MQASKSYHHFPTFRSVFQSGAVVLLALAQPAQRSSAEVEERLPGYYPTGEEVDLLGGQERALYGRHLGGINIGGPDAGSLTSSGLWRQDPDPTESFYERHHNIFGPIDTTLGFLAPREVLLMEADTPRRGRLYGYLDPGFPFTRDFNPDLATMKFGPFYLDLLSASASLLYSDYDGAGRAAQDDGWLSIASLDFRGVGQLTQNLYLTLSGSVYVLPFDGEVGFYFGNGRTSFARLAYEGYIRDWEYVIFDEFQALHPLSDILDEVEHDEIEQAGRYRFGRFDDMRSTGYFDSDAFYFINRLGAAFHGPLGPDFDASLSVVHHDYWNTASFDHVRNWDRIRAHLEYSGMDWWAIPYFQYELAAIEDWDILHHTFWLGARGRLSENLRVDAKVGYYISDGTSQRNLNQPVAELGLVHELGPNTTHSLYAGARHHIWENAEDIMATYARYTIEHRFGSRLATSAYVQYSELDGEDGPDNDREGWSFGSNLTAYVSDYTQGRIGFQYDTWDYSGTTLADRDRFIFRAAIDQRLLPYLYGTLLYQYEELNTDANSDFDEHLYMLTLRHLF